MPVQGFHDRSKKRRLPFGRGRARRFPLLSVLLLGLVLLGCAFLPLFLPHTGGRMDLQNILRPPGQSFLFGTDFLGRDLFTAVWEGGRVSLLIGVGAALVSAAAGFCYGGLCALARPKLRFALTRIAELLLSVPMILLVLFLQAILHASTPLGMVLTLGLTGWMPLARLVSGEIETIKNREDVLAAQGMNAGKGYLLRHYLFPEAVSSTMYMAVTQVSSAIGMEATLSFVGLGLPQETVTWGTLLSQAQRALLSNDWWVIVLPGVFLVVTMVSIAEIGNFLRRGNLRACSNL